MFGAWIYLVSATVTMDSFEVHNLYENYSSTEEFLPQFDANVEDIIKLLDDIPKLKEMVNNGRKP